MPDKSNHMYVFSFIHLIIFITDEDVLVEIDSHWY